MKSIRGRDLKSMIGKINIIDIRRNYLYSLGNIPTSRNIYKNFLILEPNKYLDKNK